MNKMKIKFLVTVIIGAMVGLIGIQLYWINQANELNEQQFKQSVHHVLAGITKKIETREAAGFIKKEVNIDTDKYHNRSRDKFNKDLNDKIKQGKAILGLWAHTIDKDFAKQFNLKGDYGLYVETVYKNTPAYYAGLRKGDIITHIAGQEVNVIDELLDALDNFQKGDQFNLTYERLNQEQNDWYAQCNSLDDFCYTVTSDSFSLSYSLQGNGCNENGAHYEIYIDSTDKINRITIRDSSDQAGTFITSYYGIDENINGFRNNENDDIPALLASHSVRVEQEYIAFSSSGSMNDLLGETLKDTISKVKKEVASKSMIPTIPHANIQDATQLINDLVLTIMCSEETLEERLNKFDFNQIIHDELANHGIKAEPEWQITDDEDNLVLASREYDAADAGEEPYETALFDGNVWKETGNLSVYFPEKNDRSFAAIFGNGLVPLSAFFFIVLLAFCFFYAINTMIRQKKMSELTTDFINNMTHEFKTPVSTIKLASEMILDENVPKSSLKRYIQIIQDENHRLGNQIEKVLQIAKIERSEAKLNLEPLNVHDILEDVMSHSLLQIEKKNGDLAFDFHSSNPLISADKVHLTNIFSNLIDNAIKYTPKLPHINVTTEDREEGILISIRDNGIGMSKEAQKKIFDKFYRVSTGNVHDVKGFGLGLSYVKIMTEAHGGTIDVKSKPEQGSLFQLFFPKSPNNTVIS